MYLSSNFEVIILNTDFSVVKRIDDPLNLEFTKKLNDVDSYSFSLRSDIADYIDLFGLDYIILLKRTVPGLIAKYTELSGLHRSVEWVYEENGGFGVKSSGLGLNDFIARRIINYQAGTIKAYKNDASETVMKEYVEENCGASATVANERQYEGTLEDFYVETDSGYGEIWEGDRAYENLLDVLKDIAKFSRIDFGVEYSEDLHKFTFNTYENQLGTDRSTLGLDRSTGLNSSGNKPFVFSLSLGNISSLNYKYDRFAEATVVSVLGEGELSTRDVKVRSTDAVNDSKWNVREISRSYSGDTPVIGTSEYELEVAGDEFLNESKSVEIISITPLIQETSMYGKHFFLGDLVTVYFRGVEYHKRITSVKFVHGPKDSITVSFEEEY